MTNVPSLAMTTATSTPFFRGEPQRLQRVVVESRLARPAADGGPADGVVWLIAPIVSERR